MQFLRKYKHKLRKYLNFTKINYETFCLLLITSNIKCTSSVRVSEISMSKAFEALKTDEKVSEEILDLIAKSMEARFQ